MISHRQGRAFIRLRDGDRHRKLTAVDFAFAVKFIFVRHPGGQLEGTNLCLSGRNTDLLAVEVVPLFHLPVEIQFMLILLKIEDKSLVGRREIRAAGCIKQPGKD
ncbi:hypothetical protein D3C76_1139700 [compost metagenome]